jgi:hypothetical protein
MWCRLARYVKENAIEWDKTSEAGERSGAEAGTSGRLRSIVTSNTKERSARNRDRDGATPMDVETTQCAALPQTCEHVRRALWHIHVSNA